jgi:asparagine synthase (glutamine-hydrolysing)
MLLGAYRRIRGSPPDPIWDTTYSAIDPDFAKACDVEARARAALRDEESLRRAGGEAFRISILTGGGDAPDLDSAMRPWFGIETRDPTGDLRVVNYCLAIPGGQYLHDGQSRWLIRRAMEDRLPARVLTRRTLGAQAADWTEWLPRLRDGIARELDLLERSDTARSALDLPKLRRVVQRWPDRLTAEHEPTYKLMLPRAIMMGRFVRWFEATYP